MAGQAVLNVLLLVAGFVLLVKGADFFVDGASGIAKKLRVSTFVIGVTVVALGTSAPEAAVTIVDAVAGSGDLIVGNILGSNVINIFLILGVSAFICNLPVEKATRFVDLPLLLLSSALFVLFGFLGNSFTWWEGIILLVLYFAYMAYNVAFAVKQSKLQLEEAHTVCAMEDELAQPQELAGWYAKLKYGYEKLQGKVWFLIVISVAGLGMVVGGAQLVVDSAEFIAVDLIRIPSEIVALTVVAFGTSLPELVTSVSAARKGDVGIASGNIIGSNIANVLLIGGLGMVCKGSLGLQFTTEGLISGLVALAAATIIFVFSLGKRKCLGKASAITMLSCLAAYYTFVFLNLYVFNLY